MSIQLPQRSDSKVPRPSSLRGMTNGKLPEHMLAGCGLRFKSSGGEQVMVEPAATAMRAMVAAARADGVELATSGPPYRTYQGQVNMFMQRFSRRPRGKKSKTWDRQKWWPVPGYSVWSAATPGRSNHGWGLAADLSHRDARTNLTDTDLRWLADHGPSFGFWNTVKGERFHWSYCLADEIAPAVGHTVGKIEVAAPAAIDWDAIRALDADLSATEYAGALQRGSTGKAVMAAQWKLVAQGYSTAATGTFDAATERAVIDYQRAAGHHADGVVDAAMWTALGLPGGTTGAGPRDGAPIPEPVAPPEPHNAPYVVQAGDGFERIAKRTLWSRSKKAQAAIADANRLTIDGIVHPLQHLTIPGCRFTVAGAGEGWDVIAERLGHEADRVSAANDWQPDAPLQGMVIYGGAA